MKSVSTWWILLALFLVSLSVRGAYLTLGPGPGHPLEGDEGSYHTYATSLITGNGYRSGGSLSGREPFLPFVLSALYAIHEPEPINGRWLMVIISSLVAPIIFLTSRELFGRNSLVPLLSSTGWTLYPPSVFYSSYILSENTSALLVVASLGGFLVAGARKNTWMVVATGVIMALAGLNRSSFVLLPAALLVGQLAFTLLGNIKWSWTWKMWAVGITSFLITMTPWTVRNYLEHDRFLPTTTRLGYMLVLTNGTLNDHRIQEGQYFKNFTLLDQANELSEADQDGLLRHLAIDEMQKNWKLLPRPVLNRARHFWSWRPDPYDHNWTRNDTLMILIWLPTLLLLITGGFIKSWRNTWPAITLILLTFIMVLPFWGSPRFRYPVDPILIMGGSLGFFTLMTFGRRYMQKIWPNQT